MGVIIMPKGGGTNSGSALTGGQQNIARDLSRYILGKEGKREFPGSLIGQPSPSFQGQRVTDLTPEALAGRDVIGQFDPTAFSQSQGVAVERALSGLPAADVSPEATTSFFKDAVEAPLLRTFDESVRPRIRQAFAGSGSLFTSRRSETETGALENLNTDLTGQLGRFQLANQQLNAQLRESAANRAVSAIPLAEGLAMSPIQRGSALIGAGAPFQQQEQNILDRNFEEFIRTLPENSPWLDVAMRFTGQAQKYIQPSSGGGPLSQALGGIGGAGAGALAGAEIGTSIPMLGPGWGTAIGAIAGGAGAFRK